NLHRCIRWNASPSGCESKTADAQACRSKRVSADKACGGEHRLGLKILVSAVRPCAPAGATFVLPRRYHSTLHQDGAPTPAAKAPLRFLARLARLGARQLANRPGS